MARKLKENHEVTLSLEKLRRFQGLMWWDYLTFAAKIHILCFGSKT